ncbi:MAG: YdbL family protein [Opitutaceae bacterium]
MKTKILFLLAISCLFTVATRAESAADLRHRMEQRLPQLDALKAKGIIGEDNRGFVVERQAGSPDAAGLVASENTDRTAVYQRIAQQTGATADGVGRARAKQIAENSRPGVWVQDESGQWRKK